MIVFANTTGLESLTDYDDVIVAVRELARLGKFAQHTRYPGPAGSGIQTTLWKRPGSKLRLDLQRVFATAEPRVNKEKVFKVKGKRVSKTEWDAALQKPAKQRPTMEETEETTTTYDTGKIWSLFAVQIDKSYNQVFSVNSPTYNPSGDDWANLFENSLRNSCAGMVTTTKTNLPEGFTVYDLIAGAGDLPGDQDPTA